MVKFAYHVNPNLAHWGPTLYCERCPQIAMAGKSLAIGGFEVGIQPTGNVANMVSHFCW